jgi:hypothetical protein
MFTLYLFSFVPDSFLYNRTNTGAIVGGVVGGLAVIVAVIFSLLFCRRREANSVEAKLFDGKDNPVVPGPMHSVTTGVVNGTVLTSDSTNEFQIAAAPSTGSAVLRSPTTSQISTFPSTSPVPHRRDLSQLTDEQVDFVNNLHRNNVPASAVARVIERMLAGGEYETVDDALKSGDMRSGGPPGYDFHDI